jgi:hypothetical protein
MIENKISRKVSKFIYIKTVPQTDTGVRVEETKANEWLLLKELGKKASVTSG